MILYKKNKLINGTNKYYYCYLKKNKTLKSIIAGCLLKGKIEQ